MVFACQKNSFLKEFTTSVLSCDPATYVLIINGKKKPVCGYEIICEDTILFPEGGGQPCDYGYLNEVPVLQVSRRGSQAVHFVENPIEIGNSVKQTVDWDRRLDHMQHHSGQHLITAVTFALFGYETTSWWLGEETPYIELNTDEIKVEEIKKIERVVNEKIRESIPVYVKEYSIEDFYKLKDIRSSGLPESHIGDVRVVTIEGIESDMCCGTHITNTSQLQMVKLLNWEKGKKGKINLQFLIGQRVLKRYAAMFDREQNLTNLLCNSPEMHYELVNKLKNSAKTLNKLTSDLLKEVADLQIKALKSLEVKPKYYFLHRKDADIDFINYFIKKLIDEDIFLFLTVGDDKGSGHMILYGNEQKIETLGKPICDLLEGKGFGKGNKFQAKVKNLENKTNAELLIKRSFE